MASLSMKDSMTMSTDNQWANLPKDILVRVIDYLDLNTDLSRVRGVCPTWRSAISLAEFPMPKSHFEVPSLGYEDHSLPLFLVETRFYFFTPLHPLPDSSDNSSDCVNNSGWMARMVQIGMNKWHLLNPLVNSHHDYFFSDPPIRGEINLLDCRVIELARPMSLVHGLDCKTKPISKKVVGEWDLSSSNQSVVLVQLEKEKGGGLVMLKYGDQEWIKIDGTSYDERLHNVTFKVLDIAYHKGKFYFYQIMYRPNEWQVWTINPGDCSKSLRIKSFFERYHSVYLVPSRYNDCVYLVSNEKTYFSSPPYRFFRIKEQDGCDDAEWNDFENLSDEILIFGDYVSFSLHNSTLDQIPYWNTISLCELSCENFGYFAKNCFLEGEEHLNYIKCWFNSGCFKYFERKRILFKDDKEVCDRLFFPPPAWVKWYFHDNVEVDLCGLRFPVESDYEEDDLYNGDSDVHTCGSDEYM